MRTVAQRVEETHLEMAHGQVVCFPAIQTLESSQEQPEDGVGLRTLWQKAVGELCAVETAAEALEVNAQRGEALDCLCLGNDIKVAPFSEQVGAVG